MTLMNNTTEKYVFKPSQSNFPEDYIDLGCFDGL